MMTDMSLMHLFLNASMVVKLVMAVLLLASVVSWMYIFQRGLVLRGSQRAVELFEQTFWSGIDLSKLYNKLLLQETKLRGMEAIFVAGFKEYVRLKKQHINQVAPLLEGIQRSMKIRAAYEEERLENQLALFATIQSMSPYIGLFGTVWGIMHAFRELGAVQQATIAMVAPGISEALIATAMGLIAAIPAGIAYNKYVNRADKISMRYHLFIEELIGIMQRKTYAELEKTVSEAGMAVEEGFPHA